MEKDAKVFGGEERRRGWLYNSNMAVPNCRIVWIQEHPHLLLQVDFCAIKLQTLSPVNGTA